MKHSLRSDQLDQFALPISQAIQKCVHCGFCLPSCPTYQIMGQEMDSPRGRIVLIKEVLEGNIQPEVAAPHIDRCLGCLACESSCPSGVEYGNLLAPYRSLTQSAKSKTSFNRLTENVVHQTVPYPSRFRWAMRIASWLSFFSFLAPRFLRPMLELVPTTIPRRVVLPKYSPAIGKKKGVVGLLTGCAQQVLAPEINAASIRVLNRAGFDVITPKSQSCCGALDWHNGRLQQAQKLAVGNFDLFDTDVDTIVTNAAGCGSAIQEYDVVFANSNHLDSAKHFANRVVDISVFLAGTDLPHGRYPTVTKIAYQDACHLAHAQGIRQQPRELLKRIENVELISIRDNDTCCGSAGTYNLEQPEIAAKLGEMKVQSVIDSGCQIIASGNIGCLIQMQKHLATNNSPIRAMHIVEILDASYE